MVLGVLTGFLRGRTRVPKTGFTSLSPKRAPIGYYKGKGCRNIGRHSSRGGYIIQPWKLPRYIVPCLKNFKLKPYVAHTVPKFKIADLPSPPAAAS